MPQFKTRKMRHLTVERLRSNEYMEEVRQAVVKEGKWSGSQAARLEWYALVERALRVAKVPGALFWFFIASKQTRAIRQVDELHALGRLRVMRDKETA